MPSKAEQKEILRRTPGRKYTEAEWEFATDDYKELRKGRKMNIRQFKEYRDGIAEGKFPKHLIAKALKIAKKSGGQMTKAWKQIEKIKRGLGDDPEVADALKLANEELVFEGNLDEFTLSDISKMEKKGTISKLNAKQKKELKRINQINKGNITRQEMQKVGIKVINIMRKEGVDEKLFAIEGSKIPVKLYNRVLRIAISNAGNMQKAVKEIEKLKRGLSDHKDVMNILKIANEQLEFHEGTWYISKALKKLKKTMQKPMPYDKDTFDFVAKYIGDDELWDDMNNLRKSDDTVPAIKAAFKRLGIKESLDSINESEIHLPSGKIKLIPKSKWSAIKKKYNVTVDPKDPEWVAGHPNDLYKWATDKKGLGMSTSDVKKKYKHITPDYTGPSLIKNKQREGVEVSERDYRKEYDNYQGKPEQIARRSSRNKARRVMGDDCEEGKDVGHKDNDPMNNDRKNLRNEDPSKNRAEPRLRKEAKAENKKLLKQYKKNEDRNAHTENYLLLAKAFGTPKEIKVVESILKRNKKQGHTAVGDSKWMQKYINPYYQKLVTAAKNESFGGYREAIEERKLTDQELKRREEIAKTLDDEDLKKRYGDDWKAVKMGIATNMAKKESVEDIKEAYKYKTDHKTYTSAVEEALLVAEKAKYEVDMDDYFNQIATGPRKPAEGKTNRFEIVLTKGGKEQRKKLHIQIYGKGKHGYELNCYIS